MKFTVTRLCGGKALMMIPRDDILLDMDEACRILADHAEDVRQEGAMALCNWREIETTVYEQGKIMLFPLQDRSRGIALATEMLEFLAAARIGR